MQRQRYQSNETIIPKLETRLRQEFF